MGNSSTKKDEVLLGVINKAYPMSKNYITCFFAIYLNIEYYLLYFKIAILCAIVKPRKRICLRSQSYRLITLLSYLKKVLNKVLIRQLSIFAFKTKLFSNLHSKAVLSRLAIDAAAIVIHNIIKVIEKKNVVFALTFDIKKAFDNISRNRLIKRFLYHKVLLSLI